MNALRFTLVSSLLFGTWLGVFLWRCRRPLREGLPYAGLASAAQVVATETLLGAAGLLQPAFLAGLNMLVSVGLLGWMRLRRRPPGAGDHPAAGSSAASPLTWYNLALLALLLLVTLWLLAAAWLLPTRGIDDLGYHLPALYQFVQDGRFSLLPLELRSTFAYPFNADLLFLWVLVFQHADTFVDLVQFPVALLGAATLHALARALGTARHNALFVALLFMFIPVVLGQAGSNYVDVIVAIWHLGLLYAAVRYYQSGSTLHLAMAACASGLLLGAKYSAAAFVLAVQPLILLRLLREHALASAVGRYAAHWALALPLCLYWYLRNLAATGHPLYPYSAGLSGLRPLPGTDIETAFAEAGQELGTALGTFLREPLRFLQYLLEDPGLGSLHGGFGPVFWGLAVPALVLSLYRAGGAARRGDWLPVLFWGQAPLLFLVYLAQMDNGSFHLNQRYILVLPAFGLLALGAIWQGLSAELPAASAVLRALCVGGSALSVIQLAGYQLPNYQLEAAVRDRLEGQRPSTFRYLRQSGFDLAVMSPAWELLDDLSRAAGGWNVYTAIGWKVFWTAPLFGSDLQNRVVNFQPGGHADPQAYFFHRFGSRGWFYIGREVTPEVVQRDGGYELLTQLPRTALWVRAEVLEAPAVRERLRTYYQQAFGGDIEQLRPVVAQLTPGALIVTASRWGPALKSLSLQDGAAFRVRLVPPGQELAEARRFGASTVITLHSELAGYQARPLLQLPTPTGVVSFFENRVLP